MASPLSSSFPLVVLVVLFALASAQSETGTECDVIFPVKSYNGQWVAYNLSMLSYKTFNFTTMNATFAMSFCANWGYRPKPDLCFYCNNASACTVNSRSGMTTCLGSLAYYTGNRNGTGLTFYFNQYQPNNLTVYLSCNWNVGYGVQFQKIVQSYYGVSVWGQSGIACATPYTNYTPPYPGTPTSYYNYTNCSNAWDCNSCLSGSYGSQCVYCIDSNSCMDGYMPSCSNYFKKQAYCSKVNSCAKYSDCSSCAMNSAMSNCFWCPNSYFNNNNGTCVSSGSYCEDGRITNPMYCSMKRETETQP